MGMNILTEKYRPSKIEDLLIQSKPLNKLLKALKRGVLPNLLFSGYPGTGKTSTAYVIANLILGPLIKSSFLELNASDDRGIEIIRNKVKSFAHSERPLYQNSPKIILLDESDALTISAQHA